MDDRLNGYDWRHAFEGAGPQSRVGNDYEDSSRENSTDIRQADPTDTVPLDEFTREDVAEIIGIAEGANDEASWIVCGCLNDGRWFVVEGWCDYTGWDCQSDAIAVVARSREQIVQMGLEASARARLGLS